MRLILHISFSFYFVDLCAVARSVAEFSAARFIRLKTKSYVGMNGNSNGILRNSYANPQCNQKHIIKFICQKQKFSL